ncbi:hypothetical protein XA68_16341 [Ophiocordyceps unilateralis]|uniref:Uncharacterized protein n=1 Tax=Ophiocordyceps unilateralis TaxID=268505 RepID=A0A2A9P5D5_OPHUN|nr:hypothetical protein XA68_16341 [Ophiocordyceps unilateralis]
MSYLLTYHPTGPSRECGRAGPPIFALPSLLACGCVRKWPCDTKAPERNGQPGRHGDICRAPRSLRPDPVVFDDGLPSEPCTVSSPRLAIGRQHQHDPCVSGKRN